MKPRLEKLAESVRDTVIPPSKPVYDCEHCEDKHWFYMHDPSGDGHGGLNGGSWGYFPCGQCNNPVIHHRGYY